MSRSLDTIYYHRHIDAEKIHLVLQSQSEGVSLRGIVRLSGLALLDKPHRDHKWESKDKVLPNNLYKDYSNDEEKTLNDSIKLIIKKSHCYVLSEKHSK